MKKENPAARVSANRVLDFVATAKPLDLKNPTESTIENQSELLAVRSVMRRCRVSFWHARTICQLANIGGQAA